MEGSIVINKHAIAVSMFLVLGVGIVPASDAHRVRARVTLVEPVYETVIVEEPVRSCRRDYVERRVSSPSVAGQTLAGAIVGAAIGRQFGDGSGRDALTVIGAVAGSAVANDRASRRQGSTVTIVREPVDSCTTQYRRRAERRLTGYWVEYRHRGRHYRILSREHPGREIYVEHRS
jgi:uncharacterized protein YcfJ